MKLYDAIKEIVKLKGKDIITDSALLNYLNDYHAFEERPASKLVLRDLVNGGYSDKILKLGHQDSNWTIKLKSYEHDFVDSCGYKEELVLYVFQSLAYAIDLTDKKPGVGMDEVLDFHPFFDNEQLMQSDSTSTPEPKQTADSVDDTDYLKIAQDFIENGKLDTARSIAEKIVNSSSKDDENTIKATIMLGHIMRKKSHYKEALNYYNQALNAEANLLNIGAKDLQHRITNREVKGFEDIDIHYMFCLLGIGHIDKKRWSEFVKSKASKGNYSALLYCAHLGIDPQEHINIFFTEYNELRIGDFLYEDGSFAHEQSKLKVPIGVVFSLETSDIEKHKGWEHGRIAASEGLQLSRHQYYPQSQWGKSIDYSFPHTHFTRDEMGLHMYDLKSLYSELLIDDLYEEPGNAFYTARHWKINIPLQNTSKWYLPNHEQAAQMVPVISCGSMWTSSQCNQKEAIECISRLSSGKHMTIYPERIIENKSNINDVVPIFSF
jgi:tetratricopeptide (TPR) repeat protein